MAHDCKLRFPARSMISPGIARKNAICKNGSLSWVCTNKSCHVTENQKQTKFLKRHMTEKSRVTSLREKTKVTTATPWSTQTKILEPQTTETDITQNFMRLQPNRTYLKQFQTRGSHLQLKNCIMLRINRVIPFLEGSRKDASLRLLKFSGFDLSSGQWYPYLGVKCMLDKLLLVVMICATWLWFHQSDCIVLKWEISWEKSKTPSIVDMGYICIILICQWNKLMGTPWIEDTISWMSFSHHCLRIGDRILHLDTRFAILWWIMGRTLKHWCCKRKYTSPYESSGLLSWFGLWKRDAKGELHLQTWFKCFSFERCGMIVHVSFRFAFWELLEEFA